MRIATALGRKHVRWGPSVQRHTVTGAICVRQVRDLELGGTRTSVAVLISTYSVII